MAISTSFSGKASVYRGFGKNEVFVIVHRSTPEDLSNFKVFNLRGSQNGSLTT